MWGCWSEVAQTNFPTQDRRTLAALASRLLLFISYWPEELKVQTRFGQEELVVLLEPHLAHGGVLKEAHITSTQEKCSFQEHEALIWIQQITDKIRTCVQFASSWHNAYKFAKCLMSHSKRLFPFESRTKIVESSAGSRGFNTGVPTRAWKEW